MSTTEQVPPLSSYDDIAAHQGRRSLLYVQFGSYEGEWMMFALGGEPEEYALYRDWYGSCSGCDALEGHFDYKEEVTPEHVAEFVGKYRPFALIPRETARNLVERDTLITVVPGNLREIQDEPIQDFVAECQLLVRLEENMPVTVEHALASNNQETRRRIVERVGIEKFVTATIHQEGNDKLVRCTDEGIYLWLQDSSTDRQYLLRVPPETETVRAGKAWSFGISENEYAPLIET